MTIFSSPSTGEGQGGGNFHPYVGPDPGMGFRGMQRHLPYQVQVGVGADKTV